MIINFVSVYLSMDLIIIYKVFLMSRFSFSNSQYEFLSNDGIKKNVHQKFCSSVYEKNNIEVTSFLVYSFNQRLTRPCCFKNVLTMLRLSLSLHFDKIYRRVSWLMTWRKMEMMIEWATSFKICVNNSLCVRFWDWEAKESHSCSFSRYIK